MMKNAFIVSALRTPFGSFGGAFTDISAPDFAAQVISELIQRNSIPKEEVDEVIIGQVLQGGSSQAPARQAMRKAGLPDSTHAMTINKVCGSGLKAIMLAADSIRLGDTQIAIAGGMENMSQAPYATHKTRFGQRLGNGEMIDLIIQDGLLDPYSQRHMGDITEDWVENHGLTREDQDNYAIHSYQLSQKAIKNGTFADELVPVRIKTRKGEIIVSEDEEPLRGNIDKLPGLRPAFRKNGTITAGNASSINDGAGLALLASEEAVKKHHLTPIARIVASSTNSLHPELFAEAPVDAIRKCCAKAGLQISDIGLFEINEAFSSVPLVAIKELGLDPEKVNVNGGAVSIGHPIGASGGRLVATLLREMKVRNVKYGLATLCIGGGEAVAAIFELV
ncbi:acetyl-CoA C-acetyltransferase [Desulfuromusa kysingii]|uniref:Acetyl-CoA C-acetyltransferase n=2 Tax=Desulfuromusa kysingii TaxID=37625 RepID=A0A1H3XI42_9BACT|nr:thiolase family protein [Desulfuromusa kysingii]SDZ98983.1 acetyl-CoA C-acetyltransferase [Desulfuromusa kysingii]